MNTSSLYPFVAWSPRALQKRVESWRALMPGDRFVVAVDPGLRLCGVAVLCEGRLLSCAVVRSDERTARGGFAWAAMSRAVADYVNDVVGGFVWQSSTSLTPGAQFKLALAAERMVVRKTRRDVDADDLLELAGVAGAIGGRLGLPPLMFAPEEWKGQLEKRIHHQRLLRDLDNVERTNVVDDLFDGDVVALEGYVEACRACKKDEMPPGKAHNALDAVGIGIHAGRLLTCDAPYDGANIAHYATAQDAKQWAAAYASRAALRAYLIDR